MAPRPNRTPPQRPARPLIPPIDVSDLTTYPLKKRHSKVRVSDFARPWTSGGSFEQFFASLPDLLAVKTLRAVATAIATAHRQRRPVIVGIGAHVIKVGLAPLLVDLMEEQLLGGHPLFMFLGPAIEFLLLAQCFAIERERARGDFWNFVQLFDVHAARLS